MSLLMNYDDQRFTKIAQLVFEEQFRRDPGLESQMDERRKKLMYDDVVYNLSYLLTAVYFSDGKIFEEYARWLYELLCNLMKDLDRDRVMEIMTGHYRIMSEILASQAPGILTGEELEKAAEYLELAIEATTGAVTEVDLSTSFQEEEYFDIRKAYLDALLRSRTKTAHEIIRDARKQGVPLEHIYEKILKKVMHEIGELWHRSVITVDKEHYATSVTQTVMSGFYDEIFEKPRKNRTLVACAVGSELHEMGIRMLSDMFEYQGWDTFYLGAALPEQAVLEAIGEHAPDLVALSVTMPPYLAACEGVVKAIRAAYPGVKIAVGGQAFVTTDELWKKWDIDFYSPSAEKLVRWAYNAFAA
ncbi:MAG: cobalamin-dependent protein [Synergistaceae bacterium]|nr:cobalamin-dependent protein [Synergistaceae bacterium]